VGGFGGAVEAVDDIRGAGAEDIVHCVHAIFGVIGVTGVVGVCSVGGDRGVGRICGVGLVVLVGAEPRAGIAHVPGFRQVAYRRGCGVVDGRR
jgi:hypothetical protein